MDEESSPERITSPMTNEQVITGNDTPEVIDVSSDEEEDEDMQRVVISDVLIELDANLKRKLVHDLMHICEVDEETAQSTLQTYKWNMQEAMDFLLCANNSSDDEQVMTVDEDKDKPQSCSSPGEGASTSASVVSPFADSKKEKEVEIEQVVLKSSEGTESYSTWAPEKFSILSWNLDGLDEKNLERRTEHVVQLVEREKHDVLFFQELLPHTFEYIARKLLRSYKPIPGTEDSRCEYLTAIFLRKNSVYYEDHYVMPFPNTAMGRTLLVVKAFIGRAKLALLNSHLESTGEFAKQRQEQLKTCFEIASTFDKEYNVIFGGDLNLRDKEVAGCLPSSMYDLWVKCGSRSTCQYTWDLTRNTNKQMPSKFQPRCRFDRFYFRCSEPETINPEFFGLTGIEKVSGTQSFPSDHWAILTFFALSKEARKPFGKKRKADDE